MNCDAFRLYIDLPALPPEAWPDEIRAHHEGCANCQVWLAHEQTWQYVFASVPAPRARPSVWPGVMAVIAARRAQPASLSWELVALSRYLVPALVALVLALAGVGMWAPVTNPAAPDTDSVASVLVAEPITELAFLHQDADAILNQWVGGAQP